MWILEKLLNFLTYPIRWFWNMYHKYKEEGLIWKIVVLFGISLSGMFLITIASIFFLSWLFVNHTDFVIISGLIVWLYSYVKSKMEVQHIDINDTESDDLQNMKEQANKLYPTIRNIMYQTLKVSAESIGGVIPRVLQEIEVLEQHFIISNGICFYQFRLSKADIRTRYDTNELLEFQRILQNDISRKIHAGDFPTISVEQFLDGYGNVYDAVYIDVIEDVDNCFIIQTVLYSPKYADYLRQKKMNEQSVITNSDIPDAQWKQ